MPRYSTHASVWKRQPDGAFNVVMDVGITTPEPVPFAPAFARAPFADRYTGTDTADAATRSLSNADAALTKAATSSQADAYRGRIADRGRIHRRDVMPLVGEAAGLAWLRTQPSYASGATRYAEVAASRDLGYAWGSYALPQSGAVQPPGASTRESGCVRGTAPGEWRSTCSSRSSEIQSCIDELTN